MNTPKDPSPTDVGVARDALWCASCEHEVTEAEAETLYECGTCGETSIERRCESCHKFKARSEEQGCPTCDEPLAEERVTVDYDDHTILFEDFVEGGRSRAERAAERATADAADRAEKDALREAQRREHSNHITWLMAEPGDVLVKPEPRPWESPFRFVGSKHTLPDGRVLVSLYDSSWRTEIYDPSDLCIRSTDSEIIDEMTTDATEKPYAGFARVADGDVDAASTPARGIRIEVGHATREGGLLPAIEIYSVSGNMLGRIAVLADPEIAVRVLDVMEQAAHDLAAARGATHDLTAGAEKVEVIDATWVSPEFDRSATVKVGTNTWERDMGPILNILAGSNITFANPSIVAAAVAAVRARLDHLTMIPKEVS